MPYDINNYSPTYGGVINSSGNVVNVADSLDETTGQFKPSLPKAFTFQNAATAIGNGTAPDISGYNEVTLNIDLTGTATITIEQSMDNVLWYALQGATTQNVGQMSSTFSVDAIVRLNTTGLKYIRARISAYTSGTVTVTGLGSTGTYVYQPQIVQPNTDTLSTSLYTGVNASTNHLFDGTNWVRQRSSSVVGDANAGTYMSSAGMMGYNGSAFDRVRTVNTGQIKTTLYNSVGAEPIISANLVSTDGVGTGSNLIGVASFNLGYNGATFDRVRVNNKYFYQSIATFTGSTAYTIWTPAAGKRFRLMGVSVVVTAASKVSLRDGTAGSGTAFHTFGVAVAGDTYTFEFGNGYLSSAVNNVLELYNVSATSAAFITVFGTEE